MNKKLKNLLVLDIDETLIHSTSFELDRPADFYVADFHVYRRPYLDQFINACFEWYEIGVWSSASDNYVKLIVNEIFPNRDKLHFIWGASRTTMKRTLPHDYELFGSTLDNHYYEKRLLKLKTFGWPLKQMLLVDDSPEKCKHNYGNAIYPSPFEGQENDDELKYLASYLEKLKDCQDVRKIEKRGWRNSIIPMQW